MDTSDEEEDTPAEEEVPQELHIVDPNALVSDLDIP